MHYRGCFHTLPILMSLFLALVTVHVYGGTPRSESGNFPLEGCSTDEMDVLFVYYHNYHTFQYDIASTFAKHIVDFNETSTRVMFAGVFDSLLLSADIPRENIASRNFTDLKSFNKLQKLGKDYQRATTKYNNVNETIEQKIQLVKRLFKEMGGVRKNVTKVALIFCIDYNLSFEETRSIPHIVQQKQTTDIKIFFLVFLDKYVKYIVHMRDTLLVGFNGDMSMMHVLLMAVCNQCWRGWFTSKRKDYADSMSCYYFLDSNVKVNWDRASRSCLHHHQSSLAKIESKEELDFLQTQISIYLKVQHSLILNSIKSVSIQLYIGIKRDLTKLARRFHWSHGWSAVEASPMVISHWLPGQPSRGFSHQCGAWKFRRNNNTYDVTKGAARDIRFSEGWTDVECDSEEGSLSLCEVVLPPRVENSNMMSIKAATNESFNCTLTKGDFRIYRDNIVSVSANIANTDFLEALTTVRTDSFPVFDCGEEVSDQRYISYMFVCDSIDHCISKRDEMSCFHQEFNNKEKDFTNKCSGAYCYDGSCLPLQWIGDGEVDCNVYVRSSVKRVNDEETSFVNYRKGNESCVLYCNGQCVDFSELIDNKTDCTGSDGALEETLRKLETTETCKTNLSYRIWAPRCVYIKDNYDTVLGCRDMSHLQNCTDFQCPDGYTKCPDTYCIPQHYVLDGKVDCPAGEEENEYTVGSCIGNFACWDSKVCLHPDLVCNGHPECPHQDDEVDCKMKCPEGLRCISGTVTVTDYNISEIDFSNINKQIRYLDLSHAAQFALRRLHLNHLHNLTVIKLSQCNIAKIELVFLPRGLQVFDLSYNQIETLLAYTYHDSPLNNIRHWNVSYNRKLVEVKHFYFKYLETFDLSHTSISLLHKYFLQLLPSLKHLNLSFTKINQIDSIFPRNRVYQSLDLRGLKIVDFHKDFFNGLTIRQNLYTDGFALCCPQIRGTKIPSYICHSREDAVSSCLNLVGIIFQRQLLGWVAVIAVLGNIIVIGYRVICDRSVLTTGYGLFVTNLGISDFIMGVYLFIIAGADYYYRDVYVFYDKSWRESVVCKLAGFLATLSSETSTFFIFLITLDRFLVMKFPFGQVKFSKVSKIIVLFLSWITGFLLALTPIVFKFDIYSSNSMCLGLPLTTDRLNGWEFSFAVFIVLNFCLFLLIAYGQRVIFRAMSENRVNRTALRREEDLKVAKQLSLVAMSNFLCWFPVGLMGIFSFGGHEISNDVFSWTTVIILPINSAANPLLYTIPAIMTKLKHCYVTGAVQTST